MSEYEVCVFSQLQYVYGSGRVGVNSTHSPLNVGGEAHRSIKTAHQCRYKQLPNPCAYRTQRVPVLPSVRVMNHMYTLAHQMQPTSATLSTRTNYNSLPSADKQQ